MFLRRARLAMVILGLAIWPPVAGIAGVTPIFLDGFESGDLCAWQGTCAPPSEVTGVWFGLVTFPGDVVRPLLIQLHPRDDGRLVGYLLGSSESWVVTSGSYTGGILDLELTLGKPSGDRIVTLTGPVQGGRATLALTGDLAEQTVELIRWPAEFFERRFVVVDATNGLTAPHFVSLAVALDGNGELVAGGWSGTEQQQPWGRDGGVNSFSDVGDVVTMGLDLDGGCSAGSFLEATFDSSVGLYFGTFTLIDCSSSASGALLGGFIDGTTSADAAEVLAVVSSVADQLEAGTPFASPHPSFTADYFHEGTDLAGLFSGFDDEMAAWDAIDAEILDVSRISTLPEPDERAILSRPLGIDFRQIRSGVPSGGGPREVYLDTRDDFLAPVTGNELGVFAEDAGVWKISGDQQQAFDLPWVSLPIQPGDRRLEVPTLGDSIHVAMGGYGAHFQPLTGHSYGDRKANFAGFLPVDDSEMDELIGDGIGNDDGDCSTAELEAGGCAYWAALDGSLVRDRTPWYVASQNGLIIVMQLRSAPSGTYFDDVPHWQVAIKYGSGVEMELGHIGRIDDDVALAVLAETGCDPRSWETCPGVGPGSDLLLGVPPIPVSAGDPVAQPQVFADEVPGYPGYRVGGGSFLEYPWAQMEFNVSAVVGGQRINTCVFGLVNSDRRDDYRAVMEADMVDPSSQRYRPRWELRDWTWHAECALCNSLWQGGHDFSSLFTNLGGWYERTDVGTVSDEIVAFAPIATATGLYDPSSYQPGTDTLIVRQPEHSIGSYFWTMPDSSVLEVFYPAGEILERTASSLLILWRDLGWSGGDVYQAAAFRLDEEGLTIEWGPFATTAAAAQAAAPTLDPNEPCNETTVICYDHNEQPGY